MSYFQYNNEVEMGFFSMQTFLISETNNLTLQKQMVFSESLNIINLNIYKLRRIYDFLWVTKNVPAIN